MVEKMKLEADLEKLRQELPDPFHLSAKLDDFFNSSTAQELIGGGVTSVRQILAFLQDCQEPSLARVAVLLLSYFEPSEFYQDLLVILGRKEKAMTEAFEPGLWLIKLPEKQIAQDLVNIVATSNNPSPLLLLQRPVAKEMRLELAGFIREHQFPLSLYALYCYSYSLENNDIPFMINVSKWVEFPEICSLAGIYLLSLGSNSGYVGIQAGLSATDVKLRTMTYYELSKYLPKTIVEQAKYDPVKPVDAVQAAISILINKIRKEESKEK